MNSTKQKLNSGETVVGCWIRYPDAGLAEMLAWQGWDFLVFDAEHGTIEPRDCEQLVRAAEVRDVTPIVRVPANQPPTILRFMDTGAQGVHVPFVNTASDAEAAVQAVKYWPRGTRGLGGARAAAYGQDLSFGDYVERANDETLIAAHIETRAAVDELPKIVEVDGLDIVFVGPTDLSHSLGVPGEVQHSLVESAIAEIVAAVVESPKALGVLVPNGEEGRRWQERGARYIAITIETLVRASSRAFLADLNVGIAEGI